MADLLNPDAIHHALDQLPGWAGTQEGLDKTFVFADFAESRAFVNRVADIAERLNHHPDITVQWNKVGLHIVSHAAGGVTQECLDLATAIETGEAHGDANLGNPAAGPTA